VAPSKFAGKAIVLLFASGLSSRVKIRGQVSIVILARADHDQFKRSAPRHSAGKEMLCGLNLELMDEDSAEFGAFLTSDGWILGDFPDLLVQKILLLLAEASDPLLKVAGLDDSHG